MNSLDFLQAMFHLGVPTTRGNLDQFNPDLDAI